MPERLIARGLALSSLFLHRRVPGGPALVLAVLGVMLALLVGLAGPMPDAHPDHHAPEVGPAGVVLDAQSRHVELWPALRVIEEPPGQRFDPDEVLRRWSQARPPSVPRANFGEHAGGIWLLWRLDVRPGAPREWLLDVAYPPLDEVDLHLADGDGARRMHLHGGDLLRLTERPLPSRTHLMPLPLEPGHHLVALRVATSGSLIVPVSLIVPNDHRVHEDATQMIQGLSAGVLLCLLFYALAQWYSLRDRMFVWYAVSIAGIGGFQFAFYGLGPQHVWSAHPEVSAVLPPLGVLAGIAGTFMFVDRVLDAGGVAPWVSRVMHAGAMLAGLTMLLMILGVIEYRDAQQVSKVLGQVPMLVTLPLAWRRWRAGDRAAGYVMLSWLVYAVGVVTLGMLVGGRLPATPWTLHTFQVASLFEMTMWQLVLGVRIDALRRSAEQVRRDGERLRRLADTDALTGLLNRRGLDAAFQARASGVAGRSMAIYLLDLDGFKPVNDRHGHQAGDAVLVEVAGRLSAQVRADDRVARTGGDEFVVLVDDLPDELAARRIGEQLLLALDPPIQVRGVSCRVSATIGYALVPDDGADLETLLARADAAMYAGKQAGRRQVRRATTRAV